MYAVVGLLFGCLVASFVCLLVRLFQCYLCLVGPSVSSLHVAGLGSLVKEWQVAHICSVCVANGWHVCHCLRASQAASPEFVAMCSVDDV
jgi:hypothetical protein